MILLSISEAQNKINYTIEHLIYFYYCKSKTILFSEFKICRHNFMKMYSERMRKKYLSFVYHNIQKILSQKVKKKLF